MLIRILKVAGVAVVTVMLSISYLLDDRGSANSASVAPQVLPEFTQSQPSAWINSKPLRVSDLRGKVVLLDIWTFGCWNCYRSFPWLTSLENRYQDKGLQVIGIHSPEFDRERILRNVKEKVEEFGLHHPVMIDNDFAYWKKLNNRYWPTYYVIDKHGLMRGRFIGETHEGSKRAQKVEQLIVELLNEKFSG